jgi:asparagine synthase (glutamine-hydrolysing)
MSSVDGRLWITYNGEIYNHVELRKELIQLGRRTWKTDHSDTEVILQAFAQWGIQCLERLRGMFAFALWDERTQELWLARDRIGNQAAVLQRPHGRIVFASEIKALLQDPQQQRKVHEESFFHFLSFLTSPAPYTLFEGIRKLEAGTYLRARRDGQIISKRYWELWENTQPDDGRAREGDRGTPARRAEDCGSPAQGWRRSGRRRALRGIDSSTNAALFSEGESNDVNTFTIGYDGDYESAQNEIHYADLVAKKFNTKHHVRLLNQQDLLAFLPEMIRLQDEPIADPVCVPVYYLSKLARDNGVKVCQLGEGADELFCGYPTWNLRIRLQQFDDLPVPRVLKKAGLPLLDLYGLGNDFHYEYLRRGSLGQPIFWSGAETYPHLLKQKLLSERMRKGFNGYTSWEALAPTRKRFLDGAWDQSHLNWMTYSDLNLRLPELLLMRVDKMGMGTSVEGRVPFLDHKFVEFAMSIPSAIKTRNSELKYILKKAVRGVIPDEIIDRKKQGFAVPVREWLDDELGVHDGARAEAVLRRFRFARLARGRAHAAGPEKTVDDLDAA